MFMDRMNEIELFMMFRTNARLFIRIQFISTVTRTTVTAWVVGADMTAVRRYVKLKVQRTFHDVRKVRGRSAGCRYKKKP